MPIIRASAVLPSKSTLREILVGLIAVVVGLHLHLGVVFGDVEAVEVHCNLFNWRLCLYQVRTGLESGGFSRPIGAWGRLATLWRRVPTAAGGSGDNRK
jgi:hypothetical protein